MNAHVPGRSFGLQRAFPRGVRPVPRNVVRLVIALLACGLTAVGRGEVETLATDPIGGIKVEIEGWAGVNSTATGRDVGLVPVTVRIVNDSGADRVWTVGPVGGFGSNPSVTPRARIAVAAGETGRVTLFVGNGADGGWHGGQLFSVQGYGVESPGTFNVSYDGPSHSRHGGTHPPVQTGISREVQAAQGNPFAAYDTAGDSLDMTRAPEDWRGWSAFRNVLLTEGEWQGLAGGRRKALLDWVATGGRAGVLVADRAADRLDRIGLPAAGADGRRRIGAGEVVVVPWDGTSLGAEQVSTFLENRPTFEDLLLDFHPASKRAMHGGGSSEMAAGGSGGWAAGFAALFDLFGVRSLPVGPILAFLAAFGLVAGPLNVMVIAGKQRSRMFWTTPAISLAATAFLLALMFLRDGVGGAGARRVLCLLAPQQNTLAVLQEQFSRTGVLLGSSFPIAEPAWLEPVGPRDREGEFIEADGQTRWGDWFRSRSDQAFLATAVRASRARIEVVTGATDADPPAVISSIEVPLERVFVIDEEGRYWSAENVGTGVTTPLVASDAAGYGKWFATLAADAGPARKQALDAVKNLRGHAYATSPRAAKVAVATLPSIRWIDERADFAGPFVRSGPR